MIYFYMLILSVGFIYLMAQNHHRKTELKNLQEKVDFLTMALNKREKPKEEVIVNRHFPS